MPRAPGSGRIKSSVGGQRKGQNDKGKVKGQAKGGSKVRIRSCHPT